MSSPIPPPTGERFRALHAAQRCIVSDLDLRVMLPRIAEAARQVVGVHAVAIAVIEPDDTIEQFVFSGIDDATAQRLRAVATRQSLAALIAGWPAGGTAVCAGSTECSDGTSLEYRSVALEVAGQYFGDIYVAAPVAGPFSPAEEELLSELTRSAGSAIAHARLFERARQSTEWLHASGEIARALLANADVDMLQEIVDRAIHAAGADYGQLVIPGADGDLRIIAAAGRGADALRGASFPGDISDATRIIVNGKTLRAPDISTLVSAGFDKDFGWGPVMIVPLLDAIGTRGSVIVSRSRGRAAFSADELDLFATYASQVALAMQFAEARADGERMQLVETRHDTARELHDIVMQRLFATGVGLHALTTQLGDCSQADQLTRHVQDLDETIDEIRNRVFTLEGDAHRAEPRETMFPRIALDAAMTADAVGRSARAARVARVPRTAARRGRRRSDWLDGTGERGA